MHDGALDLSPHGVIVSARMARLDTRPVQEQHIRLAVALRDASCGDGTQIRVVPNHNVNIIHNGLERSLIVRRVCHRLITTHRGYWFLLGPRAGEVLMNRHDVAVQFDVDVGAARNASTDIGMHEDDLVVSLHEMTTMRARDFSAAPAAIQE